MCDLDMVKQWCVHFCKTTNKWKRNVSLCYKSAYILAQQSHGKQNIMFLLNISVLVAMISWFCCHRNGCKMSRHVTRSVVGPLSRGTFGTEANPDVSVVCWNVNCWFYNLSTGLKTEILMWCKQYVVSYNSHVFPFWFCCGWWQWCTLTLLNAEIFYLWWWRTVRTWRLELLAFFSSFIKTDVMTDRGQTSEHFNSLLSCKQMD